MATNEQIVHKLTEAKEALSKLEAEEAEIRAIVVLAIAGPDSDPTRYASMPIEELLQLPVDRERARGSTARAVSSREGKRPESGTGRSESGSATGEAGVSLNTAHLSEAVQSEIKGLEEYVVLVSITSPYYFCAHACSAVDVCVAVSSLLLVTVCLSRWFANDTFVVPLSARAVVPWSAIMCVWMLQAETVVRTAR
jgi:hypothetical protein